MVQTKAQELRAAIQMRGWSNTTLLSNDQEDIILNSRTGCRSWKGTKWGFISAESPEQLNITIDLPRNRANINEICEQLEMELITNEEVGLSGIWLEKKADRDTLHIHITNHDLNDTVFSSESKLINFLSDARRWNCL
ncbi:hypothetical protein DH09_06290 [Bacillaceae bacterium JMAK1]|nr:hypothetical protein DH09_06290 [Bacillaceae bacterium JMAK1]